MDNIEISVSLSLKECLFIILNEDEFKPEFVLKIKNKLKNDILKDYTLLEYETLKSSYF